jgi:hypothetical protein
MSTLTEIEAAVPSLTLEQLAELERFIRQMREQKNRSASPPSRQLPLVAATGRAITQEEIDDALEAD